MTRILAVCISVVVAFMVADAYGVLVPYGVRADFESQGTILENYGFEDYPAGSFSFPGDPWTAQ